VKAEIVRATHRLRHPDDLSISFIQIGDDHRAAKFLHDLDENLYGARFGIFSSLVNVVSVMASILKRCFSC
jgi:hypothetical protein